MKRFFFKANFKIYTLKLGIDILGNIKSTTDVVEIVPIHLMQSDDDFNNYIRESNNELGQW